MPSTVAMARKRRTVALSVAPRQSLEWVPRALDPERSEQNDAGVAEATAAQRSQFVGLPLRIA